jgi:hypothetical protein
MHFSSILLTWFTSRTKRVGVGGTGEQEWMSSATAEIATTTLNLSTDPASRLRRSPQRPLFEG